MNQRIESDLNHAAQDSAIPAAARAGFRLLKNIKGRLDVSSPAGRWYSFWSAVPAPDLHHTASLQLNNWRVFSAALKSGDIGFAESYMDGDWTSPDLVALLRLLIANREQLEKVVYGRWWGRLAYRVQHFFNRNTKNKSRRNIYAHYDLGNDFYALWLDPSMNYSAACFDPLGQSKNAVMPLDAAPNPWQSIESAQWQKVRRALQMVGLKPDLKDRQQALTLLPQTPKRVLEIGCGWGALAELAAREFGAHVTGLTLSPAQLAFAQERLDGLGLGAQTELRLQDYRDLTPADAGSFDAVCSIEMIEAVGQAYWPAYFAAIAKALKPGGLACIQSIVIADELFERYLSGTDFIQQYVFPGGCLPSDAEFRKQAAQAGLKLVNAFHFGHDYAQTLRLWRERFMSRQVEVKALGFDERFIRLWAFYLAYCEAAFAQGNTDVVQYTLEKM
jgi:cyclopropane-fatty-acyl-phospholipid synthase